MSSKIEYICKDVLFFKIAKDAVNENKDLDCIKSIKIEKVESTLIVEIKLNDKSESFYKNEVDLNQTIVPKFLTKVMRVDELAEGVVKVGFDTIRRYAENGYKHPMIGLIRSTEGCEDRLESQGVTTTTSQELRAMAFDELMKTMTDKESMESMMRKLMYGNDPTRLLDFLGKLRNIL